MGELTRMQKTEYGRLVRSKGTKEARRIFMQSLVWLNGQTWWAYHREAVIKELEEIEVKNE